MKYLFVLLFFFPCIVYSQNINQEYVCQFKLNEWAQWQPVDATILIKDKTITLKEVEGIKLVINYDHAITSPDGVQYFMINSNAIRMTINGYIISVLEKHFKCELKS